jgi:predicted outer membrane protein
MKKVFPKTLLFAFVSMMAISLPAAANISDTTKSFIQKAAIGGKFEVLSSQLALERSKNENIRIFRWSMIIHRPMKN